MQTQRPNVKAFTLIELLVVMVILGVLIGILLPSIFAARRTAIEAKASSEMRMLDLALESFRQIHGHYPPSRLVLYEDGGFRVSNPPLPDGYKTGLSYANDLGPGSAGGRPGVGPTGAEYQELARSSYQALRELFPRIHLSLEGPALVPDANGRYPNGFYDLDCSGGIPDPQPYYLEGPECLVLFLGGLPHLEPSDAGLEIMEMTGLATNPQNPFLPMIYRVPQPGPNGPTRTGFLGRRKPFYEFPNARLLDDDGDGVPGFIDPLNRSEPRYFAYFRANGRNGYDGRDFQIATEPLLASHPAHLAFPIQSRGPNPYSRSDPLPADGLRANYFEPNTFQLFSSGFDRQYGQGGRYEPAANDPFPGATNRTNEHDNVMGFGR